MNEKLILDVQNLTTTFKTDQGNVVAVDNISYRLRKKEILGIVGESGSGKTVSNMSVMRLYDNHVNTAVHGNVLFRGKNLLELSKKEMRTIRGRKIAMIFQNPMSCLNPFLTIGQQLIETVLLHTPMTKKDAFDYSVEMLRKVHIPDPERRIKQYPHHFSGGMRQRVMIAIALCCEPEILIADEPTTALDVSIQAQIINLLKDLQKNLGLALLFISHDLAVVRHISHRVAIMYCGKIVETGKVSDLYENPLHPYTQALLSAVNVPDPIIEKKRSRILLSGNVPSLTIPPNGCQFYERCAHAMPRCKTHNPQLLSTDTNTNSQHEVACFLYS